MTAVNTSEVLITRNPIVSSQIRQSLAQLDDCGGLCSFEGLIRNHNHGKNVTFLEYEAYTELAEFELHQICSEAREKFALKFTLVHHRIGELAIGDVAVLIYALSVHRDAAFLGCRYIIDTLKTRVPIWKKEHYEDSAPVWTKCTHS